MKRLLRIITSPSRDEGRQANESAKRGKFRPRQTCRQGVEVAKSCITPALPRSNLMIDETNQTDQPQRGERHRSGLLTGKLMMRSLLLMSVAVCLVIPMLLGAGFVACADENQGPRFQDVRSDNSPVTFQQSPGSLAINIHDRPFATYVWQDAKILRPYFAHLHAPDGQQVTRRLPPVAGQDAMDHADMHPGLWLAFGDLSGIDFWRNKGKVQHAEFVEDPRQTTEGGGFCVRNRYLADDQAICEEICRINIRVRGENSYLIDWRSEFSGSQEFSFGDQEEMGLGVRLATALAVKRGGRILNSDGLKNEQEVWGKPADWSDYSGTVDRRPAGVTIFTDPKNFRRCWFHARDYGLLVANPFGRNAFTKGEKSRITVKPGDSLRLRFGVLVHNESADLGQTFQEWQDSLR